MLEPPDRQVRPNAGPATAPCRPLRWRPRAGRSGPGPRRSALPPGQAGDAVSYTHLTLPTICSV
eukprot:12500697-Alexandrium_andersonii.AAC.1